MSINWTQLEISGDGSNVTVAAGVTVDSSGTMAVKTPDAVNVTITNNGTIAADGNYGIRTTAPGAISSLTNNGPISAEAGGTGNVVIINGGAITSWSNAGTRAAGGDGPVPREWLRVGRARPTGRRTWWQGRCARGRSGRVQSRSGSQAAGYVGAHVRACAYARACACARARVVVERRRSSPQPMYTWRRSSQQCRRWAHLREPSGCTLRP